MGAEAVEWKDFVQECLSKSPSFEYPLYCDKLSNIETTAVTVINQNLFDRAVHAGFPGIAVSICDCSREAVAFAVSRAVENVLKGESTPFFERDDEDIAPGSHIVVGDMIVEYVGIEDYAGNRNLKYKQPVPRSKEKSDNIRGFQLHKLPFVHKATSESECTSVKKCSAKEMAAIYENLPIVLQRLYKSLSAKVSPVVLATSSSRYANIPPSYLDKLKLEIDGQEYDFSRWLKTGYLSNGELKYGHRSEIDSLPALFSLSREDGIADFYELYCYLEDGNDVDMLVVEVSNAENLENRQRDLMDIIEDFNVPVIFFCDEIMMRSSTAFADMGIPTFTWDEKKLQALEEECAKTRFGLSSREVLAVHRSFQTIPVQDDEKLFRKAAAPLYSLNGDANILSEAEQVALLVLIRQLSWALRQTECLTQQDSKIIQDKIQDAAHVLIGDQGARTLTGNQIRELNEALGALRELTLPDLKPLKEEEVYQALMRACRDQNQRVCLVVSNAESERTTHSYWIEVFEEEGIDPSLLRIVTPRQLIKSDLPQADEIVFISGWFRRDEMERLTYSGLSSRFLLFAYVGDDSVELESQWYMAAFGFWQSRQKKQVESSNETLASLGIKPVIAEKSSGKILKGPEDTSLSGVAREIEKAHDRAQTATEGEESALGRCVHFTDGTYRWLRVTENGGSTLIVVSNVLEDEGGPVRKSASLLQEGDLVLRTEADALALEKESREFGSYERAEAIALQWRKPIDSFCAERNCNEAIKRILNAGCKRSSATIRGWVKGKVEIAPSDPEDIAIIGRAFDMPFSEEEIGRIMAAASMLRGDRIKSGKKLSSEIAMAFVEDVRAYGDFEFVKSNFKHNHPEMGKVWLYTVDFIGDSLRVPLSKFAWPSE